MVKYRGDIFFSGTQVHSRPDCSKRKNVTNKRGVRWVRTHFNGNPTYCTYYTKFILWNTLYCAGDCWKYYTVIIITWENWAKQNRISSNVEQLLWISELLTLAFDICFDKNIQHKVYIMCTFMYKMMSSVQWVGVCYHH